MQICNNVYNQNNTAFQANFLKPSKSPRIKKEIISRQTDEILKSERRRGLRYGEDKFAKLQHAFVNFALLGCIFIASKIKNPEIRTCATAIVGGGALTLLAPGMKLTYQAVKGANRVAKRLKKAGFNYNARCIAVNQYLKERGDAIFMPLTRLFAKGAIAKAGEKNIFKKPKDLLKISADKPINQQIIDVFEKAGFSNTDAIELIKQLKDYKWIGSKNLNNKELAEVAEDLEHLMEGPHYKEFEKLEEPEN